MEQEYEAIDLKELLLTLYNHAIIIILVAVLAGVAGFLGTKTLITPQYQARATMIVNTRKDQNANVTNDQITSAKNLVATYSVIIKSDTVLDKVIENLQLNMNYNQLRAKVGVSAVEATQVMQVVVTDPDPILAEQITAEITKIAPPLIVEMVEAGSVKVISAARAGSEPVSPNVQKNTLLAVAVGMVLATGIVLLKELLDNSFKSDGDITKHLGLTILGVIPKVVEKDDKVAAR